MKLKNNLSNQELHNIIQQQNTIIQKQMNIIQNIQTNYMIQKKNKDNSHNIMNISENDMNLPLNFQKNNDAYKIKIKEKRKYNKNYKKGMYNNNIYNNIM